MRYRVVAITPRVNVRAAAFTSSLFLPNMLAATSKDFAFAFNICTARLNFATSVPTILLKLSIIYADVTFIARARDFAALCINGWALPRISAIRDSACAFMLTASITLPILLMSVPTNFSILRALDKKLQDLIIPSVITCDASCTKALFLPSTWAILCTLLALCKRVLENVLIPSADFAYLLKLAIINFIFLMTPETTSSAVSLRSFLSPAFLMLYSTDLEQEAMVLEIAAFVA